MPIETAIKQAAIADTLVDTNPETNGSLGSVSELYERAEAANTPNEFGLYPEDVPQEQDGQDAEGPEQYQEQEERPEAEQAVNELQDEMRDELAQQLANEQRAPEQGVE